MRIGRAPIEGRPALSEAEWQRMIIAWARDLGWHHFHPRVMQGSQAGWPDLALWRPGKFILAELKSEKGRLSALQEQTIRTLRLAGVDVRIWRPSDEAEVLATLRTGPLSIGRAS